MEIHRLIIVILGLILFTGCGNQYEDLPRSNINDTAAEAWYMARKALVIAQENKETLERLENR